MRRRSRNKALELGNQAGQAAPFLGFIAAHMRPLSTIRPVLRRRAA